MHPIMITIFLLTGCQDGSEATSNTSTSTTSHSQSTTTTTTTSGTDDILSLLEEKIGHKFDDSNMVGMATALVVDGEVAWSKGYGMANIEENIEATENTSWLMASVSKLITGTAVMQMVENGQFTLESPVNDIIDFEYDNPKTEGEDLLVKNLVSHTGSIMDSWIWGMPNQEGALYGEGDSDISLQEIIHGYFIPKGEWYSADDNFLNFMVGEQYMYSNFGADLAGYLIESSIGVGLDEHSTDAIFNPLKMDDTSWRLDNLDEANVAMPYRTTNDGDFVPYGHYGYPDYPSGLLRASAADLGRFIAAYSNGGELDGERVLEASTIDTMYEPILPDVISSQGVFWYWSTIEGRDVIGHGGSDFGVSTDLLYDPNTGVGVVLMTNVDWGDQVTLPIISIEQLMFDAGEALAAE